MPVSGQAQAPGTFIISLDFELHWGIRDVKTVAQYRENLLGVRRAVPAMLATFAEYDVHATWATVGFLFFSRRNELLRALPAERPHYDDAHLSAYAEMGAVGQDENEDPFHFGRSLLEQIQSSPAQEIGTHTFSHYYCLEPVESIAAFQADLRAALAAAADFGVVLKSIVFPRNQYDEGHLRVCGEMGLKAFRGNPQSWLYRPRVGADQTRSVRAARLIDSYCDLSSHNCYSLAETAVGVPKNLPASRFLRPYTAKVLAALQERRIKGDLTYAAQRGLVYHLWWHPHNFGAYLEKNIGMLRRILDHFQGVRERYDMQSKNMAESALNSSEIQDHVVIKEDRLAGQRR
ncbi:MAG TPA: polysaccharide deacetylase [Candidatus Polarisedimenticolia bacterium]|nr:polysaccharide deacetylase [Candidatus Polarisedimenticolia bacterium]